LITLVLALGLLTACAEFNPHSMDMDQAVHNAKTKLAISHRRLKSSRKALKMA